MKLYSLLVLALIASAGNAQGTDASLMMLDRSGRPATEIVDGDSVSLMIILREKKPEHTPVWFAFGFNEKPFVSCIVPPGADTAFTEPLVALGWFWDRSGNPCPSRRLLALTDERSAIAALEIRIHPRPVVLVHGFISNAGAWSAYTAPGGFLATLGLKGFAVGDGHVEGTMNTGEITDPARPTNTIAQNAEILGTYIRGVKIATGAQQVDLIAHSMGGLISRYYIDRLMKGKDVAQLIMLGSPHGGSDCANLPAALGFYIPAALELRPSYLSAIFNKQITHRRGVNFCYLAGTPIAEAFKSPCTDVPSDIVVSLGSASALDTALATLPLLHTDMTGSVEVFQKFVQPLLQKPGGEFRPSADNVLPEVRSEPLQFTQVFTGHVAKDSSKELVVNIERDVSVASFALYDITRSLGVSVRGASGNIIVLDSVKHGLRVIDDPSTLVYLGYGFSHPKPGPWRVTVASTDSTPASGADFAVMAKLQGTSKLTTTSTLTLPRIDEPVEIRAHLEVGGHPVPLQRASAIIRHGENRVETLQLGIVRGVASGAWKLKEAGMYGIDIAVETTLPDGTPITRMSFLALEVQPAHGEKGILVVVAVGAVLVLAVLLFFRRAKRRQ